MYPTKADFSWLRHIPKYDVTHMFNMMSLMFHT